MASKLIGDGVVYGMDGRTVLFAGVTVAQADLTGANLRDTFDKAELKGSDGRRRARGAANRSHMITVDLYFKSDAGTPTRALADAQTVLPGMFALVTLGGFNNALYDGTWNYEEGTIADSSTDFRKATLTLSRMEKADGSMEAMSPVA